MRNKTKKPPRRAYTKALHADPGFQRRARESGVWVDIDRPAGSLHLVYRFFSSSSGRELLAFCSRTRVVRVPGFRTRSKAANQWQALGMAARLEAGQPVAEALAARPSSRPSGQAA